MIDKCPKWHILERRDSPILPQVQKWEYLPYHFGLQDEGARVRRNAETCPSCLVPFLHSQSITIQKRLRSKSSSTPVLRKKSFANCRTWGILTSKGQGRVNQERTFHIEKWAHPRKLSNCELDSNNSSSDTGFSVISFSEKIRRKTKVFQCSGRSGQHIGAVGHELLIEYFVPDPHGIQPISIELGSVFHERTLHSSNPIAIICNKLKVFKSFSQYSQKNGRKMQLISVNLDNSSFTGCLSQKRADKEKWTLEFSTDLEPLAKALIISTALFIIDGK